MSAIRQVALAALMMFAACEPAQWSVTVYTDARVPQFGDRLLVELLNAQGVLACKDCRRQFSAGEPGQWPVSFGIDPQGFAETPLHVRAQLYRADHANPDARNGGVYLDALGQLPELGDKAVAVGIPLSMECFQVASQLSAGGFKTCDPTTGDLAAEPTLAAAPQELPGPGSWEPGRDRPCEDQPKSAMGTEEKMLCIAGGAFVRGSLRYLGNPNGAPSSGADIFAAEPEGLVVLSPFAIDADEFSVRDLFQLQLTHKNVPMPVLRGSSGDPDGFCNATGKPEDATNQRPLNCVSFEAARTLCELQMKRLPTEAEWEFAAGNRTLETLYPWGAADDVCAHAIVGRGSLPTERLGGVAVGRSADCRWPAAGQMLPLGLPRERLADDQNHSGVRDLGGSLAEWVLDGLNAYSRPCWGRDPVLRRWVKDPLCNPAGSLAAHVRGGSWVDKTYYANVAQRNVLSKSFDTTKPLDASYFGTGFRCVRQLAGARP